MKPAHVNLGMLLAASAIYGSIFVLNKLASEAGWVPLDFAFVQSAISGAALMALALLRGGLPRLGGRLMLSWLVIGSLFVGLPITLLSHVAPHLPAATTSLVLALSPVVTLVAAILVGLERFRWQALAGVGCGLAGIAVLVAPDLQQGRVGGAGWFLAALLAPVMFGLGNVLSSLLRPPATSSLLMAGGSLLGSTVGLLPILAFSGLPAIPGGEGLPPVLLASLVNAAFFLLLFEIIRRAGPTFFAQFNYLAVLAGATWGAVIFAERPEPVFWIALALMLAGALFATRAVARPAPGG